jgi:hypothetical protein
MFVEEFASQLYKYNILVDQYGNRFEVLAEKIDGGLCFTQGWSQIRGYYHDVEGKGGWASFTYIRPKLFVLILKDMYYRDLVGKDIFPPHCFSLAHSVFGPDEAPGWAQKMCIPYRHDSRNFENSFVITLFRMDILSGFLVYSFPLCFGFVLILFMILFLIIILCVFPFLLDYGISQFC